MTYLKKLWKTYKYRFTPWIAFNFSNKAKRSIKSTTITRDEFTNNLLKLLEQFKSPPYEIVFKDTKDRIIKFKNLHLYNQKILFKVCGFQLELRPSTIPIAGRGVFVKAGKIKKGQIACLYPGLIYQPHHPILLASIRNAYIFRCCDGIMIDGKSRGLSAFLYKSVHGRERVNGYEPICDVSWLHEDYHYHVNPLNIGQIVNNQNSSTKPNVIYEELDIHSEKFASKLSLLPNISYDTQFNSTLKLVPLVALRDINTNEELFSSYFTIVE